MLWGSKRPDRSGDPERDDVWRKQLISRLSDVQVALWASDAPAPLTNTRAEAQPYQQSSPAALYATPENVFTGLAPQTATTKRAAQKQAPQRLHSKPQTAMRVPVRAANDDLQDPFSAWDEIDEQRRLAEHARQLTSRYQKRARLVSVLTIASVTTVLGVIGLFGYVIIYPPIETIAALDAAGQTIDITANLAQHDGLTDGSQDQDDKTSRAEPPGPLPTPAKTKSTALSLVSSQSNGVPTHKAPKTEASTEPHTIVVETSADTVIPAVFVSEPPRLPPASKAADTIADLLAASSKTSGKTSGKTSDKTSGSTDEASRIAAFNDAMPTHFLAPVTTLAVNERGEASFPFVLQFSSPDMHGARILLHGLPNGVELTVGSPQPNGLWMFDLTDLPEQKLFVVDQTTLAFELRLGILLARGEIIGSSPLQVRLDQKPHVKLPSTTVVRLKAEPAPVVTTPPIVVSKMEQTASVKPTVTPSAPAKRTTEAQDDDDEPVTARKASDQKSRQKVKAAPLKTDLQMALGASAIPAKPGVSVRSTNTGPATTGPTTFGTTNAPTQPVSQPTAKKISTGPQRQPDWMPKNDN
jgi:hypothetical protein